MSGKDNGGPAFPRAGNEWDPTSLEWVPAPSGPGMTLRDWFAGQALAFLPIPYRMSAEGSASAAYEIADAMLKERQK